MFGCSCYLQIEYVITSDKRSMWEWYYTVKTIYEDDLYRVLRYGKTDRYMDKIPNRYIAIQVRMLE